MVEVCQRSARIHTDALESHFREIIDQMGDCFTFHKFVLRLAHQHQHEYIDALVEHRDKKSPFQSLHAELERRLHSRADQHDIELLNSAYPSKNIFGSSSPCGQWRKK
jgi:hypothetical protein